MTDDVEYVKGDAVVFDLETASMAKRALVFTLSAVRFNKRDREVGVSINNGKLDTTGANVLHLKLNVTEQILAGRLIDPDTISWWNKQPPEAREELICGKNTSVKDGLILFADFVRGAQVFCRGTDFDPPIVSTLFADFDVKLPWKYNQPRDVRTYIDALSGGTDGYLSEWKKGDWFISHHSLHDCIRDAEQMQMAAWVGSTEKA